MLWVPGSCSPGKVRGRWGRRQSENRKRVKGFKIGGGRGTRERKETKWKGEKR